jgi:hypothetical protein
MIEKLDNSDTSTRKGYIRSIVDAIEVDDKAIRIVGSKDVLQMVIAGKQNANGNVGGFVRKWRAMQSRWLVAPPPRRTDNFYIQPIRSWSRVFKGAVVTLRSVAAICSMERVSQ